MNSKYGAYDTCISIVALNLLNPLIRLTQGTKLFFLMYKQQPARWKKKTLEYTTVAVKFSQHFSFCSPAYCRYFILNSAHFFRRVRALLKKVYSLLIWSLKSRLKPKLWNLSSSQVKQPHWILYRRQITFITEKHLINNKTKSQLKMGPMTIALSKCRLLNVNTPGEKFKQAQKYVST